jgi:hypothetical protein
LLQAPLSIARASAAGGRATAGNVTTSEHLAEKSREKELRESQRFIARASFSHFSDMSNGGSAATTRDSFAVRETFDNSAVLASPAPVAFTRPSLLSRASMSFSSAIPGSASKEERTTRESFALGGPTTRDSIMAGGPGGVMDFAGNNEIAEVFAKVDTLSTENARLLKELGDLRKKYDILRTIHSKANKSTRELKKEMDGLKGVGDNSNNNAAAASGADKSPAATSSAMFGLGALSLALSRPMSSKPSGATPTAAGVSAAATPPMSPVRDTASENDANKLKSPLVAAQGPKPTAPESVKPTVLFEGPLMRRSTGLMKNFKPAFVVLTDVTLTFYADDTMKKADYSFQVEACVASAGPKDKDNTHFTVSCDAVQIVLKADTAVSAEDLIGLINGMRLVVFYNDCYILYALHIVSLYLPSVIYGGALCTQILLQKEKIHWTERSRGRRQTPRRDLQTRRHRKTPPEPRSTATEEAEASGRLSTCLRKPRS